LTTLLSDVIEVIDMLKSNETPYYDQTIPVTYAKFGVVEASIQLGRDFNITVTDQTVTDANGATTTVKVGVIDVDLTNKEVYLCGLYSFRNYAYQDHSRLMEKAVNFKTINFAVTGLSERAKEAMRIIQRMDDQIESTLNAMMSPAGHSDEMRGDAYGTDSETIVLVGV
jgi:hypothetical protein